MLAKDIVRATNQIKKLQQFSGQLTAVSMRISSCATLNDLGAAMNSAAKAMNLVSSKLDEKKLAFLSKTLEKEDMKMDIKNDIISDVLDSLGEGLNDEKMEDELYSQVLMEAGVKLDDEIIGPNKDPLQPQKVRQKEQMVGEGGLGVGGAGENAENEKEDALDAMLKSLQ